MMSDSSATTKGIQPVVGVDIQPSELGFALEMDSDNKQAVQSLLAMSSEAIVRGVPPEKQSHMLPQMDQSSLTSISYVDHVQTDTEQISQTPVLDKATHEAAEMSLPTGVSPDLPDSRTFFISDHTVARQGTTDGNSGQPDKTVPRNAVHSVSCVLSSTIVGPSTSVLQTGISVDSTDNMLSDQTPTTPESSVCDSSGAKNLTESSIYPTGDSHVEDPVTSGLTNPDTSQEEQSVPETSCSVDSDSTTTPIQLLTTETPGETGKYKEQGISKQGFQTEKHTSEIVTDKFECSFTESDDSDSDGEHSKMKKKDNGFFQITFDMDDDSIQSTENSEHGTFLTCCVCGKELPETTVAEAGKEMCNTCRLVRFMPEETKAKGKRGRKKTLASSESKVAVKPAINKCPKKSTVKEENNDTIAPIRKSTRKRVSTIVFEQTVGDSEEDISLSEDMNAADDEEDNYTDAKHGTPREKKCMAPEEISKSKYAQELNLTPTVKSETDGTGGTTESEIPAEVMSLIIRGNMPPRKKGRPKGSKNKPKMLRAEKVAKRDMRFNKRWYRGRGPVPDANPDSADGLWACEFCGKAFPIRRNFLAHRRKHSGRHKCDECGDTFECNSKLQRHIRRHRGEKPFACHLCPKAYSENMWLQRHLATHLSEGHAPQPKPYQCNICGRQYTHKGTMIYHVKTHTETKFYQCDVCGKQFTHRSSLECHIKTHTGEKPYVCEVCGKRFADRSVQLRHTRSHSGDKPYKCSVCDKGFTQSGTLNIHMRLHTSEKPYKCKICGIGFLKRCDLSKHSKCHVGEMLTKKANLITCRVNEGRGADIQEKAAQILINAYGEKRADGTIEIKTRQPEQPVDTEQHEQDATAEQVEAGRVVDMIQTVGMTPGDTHHFDQHTMSSHHEVSEQEQVQQHSEEIQRRALEFLALRRREIEQQEGLERIQILHPPLHRPTLDHGSLDRPIMEHHSVEMVPEQQASDRQRLEQQIERHVDQHPVERQLLEQVEGQVIGQPQMMENQETEQQRHEHMSSPQQQQQQQQQQQEPVWMCKYT